VLFPFLGLVLVLLVLALELRGALVQALCALVRLGFSLVQFRGRCVLRTSRFDVGLLGAFRRAASPLLCRFGA
jgi:hypothetical protein